MKRLRMTKTVLARRRKDLAGYGRALPSLELKRQQLVVELAAERRAADLLRAEAGRLRQSARAIRFAADGDIALEPLVRIVAVTRGHESLLGIALPAIEHVEWDAQPPTEFYPPWVDAALAAARSLAEALLRIDVADRRCDLVSRALRKVIQRINLLERVLIPSARQDIARIATFLADAERMATARTKLLVTRRAARKLAL